VVERLTAAAIRRSMVSEHPAMGVRGMRRAFSLVDVLVTLAVISVLIGLLLPTLSGVREATRQVVCRSNVRQHGFGIALFADDHNGSVPQSSFALSQPHLTTVARKDDAQQPWEGLGHLFNGAYLSVGGVFYCPSHTGSHPLNRYAERWIAPAEGIPVELRDIVTNFQYRGAMRGYQGGYLPTMPGRAAIVVDALRTQSDFNHRIGTNVLRADLSANWYADPSARISGGLPAEDADPAAANKVNRAWDALDFPVDPAG